MGECCGRWGWVEGVRSSGWSPVPWRTAVAYRRPGESSAIQPPADTANPVTPRPSPAIRCQPTHFPQEPGLSTAFCCPATHPAAAPPPAVRAGRCVPAGTHPPRRVLLPSNAPPRRPPHRRASAPAAGTAPVACDPLRTNAPRHHRLSVRAALPAGIRTPLPRPVAHQSTRRTPRRNRAPHPRSVATHRIPHHRRRHPAPLFHQPPPAQAKARRPTPVPITGTTSSFAGCLRTAPCAELSITRC